MKSIGMDIHTKQTHFCVLDLKGNRVERGQVETTESALSEVIGRYLSEGVQVAIEASTITWWVKGILEKAGAKVEVTNPYKLKLISESRSKTDKSDAEILAELLRCGGLPTAVYAPTAEMMTLRQKISLRRGLVKIRSQVICSAKAHLRGRGHKPQVRELHSLTSWKNLVILYADSAWYLDPLRETFEVVSKQITDLEINMGEEYSDHVTIKLLQTIPGIGAITSVTLLACIADANRFASSKQVAAYAGLVPSQRSSGDRINLGGITCEGRSELRGAMVQAAWGALRTRKDSALHLKKFYYRLMHKSGKSQIAIVALAHKLLTIAYHVMRSGKKFEGSLTQNDQHKAGEPKAA